MSGKAVGKEGGRGNVLAFTSREAPGAKWKFRSTRWLKICFVRPQK